MVPREIRGALAGLTVAFASGVMVAFSQCNSPEQPRVPGPEQSRGLRAPATGSVNAASSHPLAGYSLDMVFFPGSNVVSIKPADLFGRSDEAVLTNVFERQKFHSRFTHLSRPMCSWASGISGVTWNVSVQDFRTA